VTRFWSFKGSATNIRNDKSVKEMGKKNLEERSGSPRRNEQKPVRIDVDFEDLLAAAVASVIIKRPKKRKFTSRR
jgi:hypothetical protein